MTVIAPHPEPRHLPRRLPLVERVGPFVRIHRVDREPLFFGRTGHNRFDAPAGEFGVLYVADAAEGAFIETFGYQTGVRVVTRPELEGRGLAEIAVARPLRLVDLTGPGLARLGADNRLTDGPHDLAQRWSLALHQHALAPDGLVYRARHDPSELCAALFDRVGPSVRATSLGSFAAADQIARLGALLDRYEFALI